MKIGIVTIVSQNYGNRLQNYALQTYLRKIDNEIEVFTFRRNYSKNVFLGKAKNLLNNIIHKKTEYEKQKARLFEAFDKEISFAPEIIYRAKKNKGLGKKYDYFLAGSDQVWNPEYPITSSADFMQFTEKNKRLSYSASIGVSNFNNCSKNQFRSWINGVKTISVREDVGKVAIKELTGRDVEVHVDPTLLLTKAEWENVEQKPSWYKSEKYILAYFLGPVPKAAEKMMQDTIKENGQKVIYIDLKSQGVMYAHGPSEFIWLIHHAEKVYTDSFHGTVFSLIFDRPFVVFKRTGNENSTGSRIESLLKKFDITREVKNVTNVNNVDREKFKLILEKEKLKSREYLNRCLGLL